MSYFPQLLHTCCGCFSLRTGAVFIFCFHIFFAGFSFSSGKLGRVYYPENYWHRYIDSKNVLPYWIMIALFIGILGTFWKKKSFLVPFIYTEFLLIMSYVLVLCFGVESKQIQLPSLWIVFRIYFLVVVYSYAVEKNGVIISQANNLYLPSSPPVVNIPYVVQPGIGSLHPNLSPNYLHNGPHFPSSQTVRLTQQTYDPNLYVPTAPPPYTAVEPQFVISNTSLPPV